ncbi:Vacuolar assembly/sorting protein PEP5/VPS11 [Ceraceosorus bombacis]|uniref:Vacuolar assembly/sorting protein PEP5/VPS11 n=1 Tax=Ceraceosorus bombacis TaxID=401625 RepID=A0A0P1BMA7_9BASI|nr:Vacuolar assembly/sorting protein PEP5/VPS11 [Ceraceosorus bombacis]
MSQAATEQVASASGGAVPAWRNFSFYDATKLSDAEDLALPPRSLRNATRIVALTSSSVCPPLPALQDATATEGPHEVHSHSHSNASTPSSSSHPSDGCIISAQVDGRAEVLHARTYATLASWNMFPGGRATHLSVDGKARLICIGEEAAARFPVLRIWDLRRVQQGAATWAPLLLASARVQHGSKPLPVAALAHTPSLTYLSVALADGSVLLLRSVDASLSGPITSSTVTANAAANSGALRGDGLAAPAFQLPKFKVVFQPSKSSAAKSADAANAASAAEIVTSLGFSEVVSASRQDEGKAAAATAAPAATTHIASRQRLNARGELPRSAMRKQQGQRLQKPLPLPLQSASAVHLLIVTLERVLRYNVLGPSAGNPAAVVDDVGCGLSCGVMVQGPLLPASSASTVDQQSALQGKMVIARQEAIYIVGAEGREVCLAYDEPKRSVHLLNTHLVIVSPPVPVPVPASALSAQARKPTSSADPAAAANLGRRASSAPKEVVNVTIFDLVNKLIAFKKAFDGGVRMAWTDPTGNIAVLSDDGTLTRLEEKGLQAKLEMLFRKSLYLLAINVAKSHRAKRPVLGNDSHPAVVRTSEGQPDDQLLGEIYRRYGDHLYAKGDYDGAMAQFVKTIGLGTQPSYIIRQFLDAQRIAHLTTYLQELHARGQANSDHTTLLLNCYTKLKDVASLDRFIKRPVTRKQPGQDDTGDDVFHESDVDQDRDELPFDLATAMQVCRQAGYHGHAAYLAKRYHRHEEYLQIQLDDVQDYDEALTYLRTLSPQDLEMHLQRVGKKLLAKRTTATTDLLIELCSGAFSPSPIAIGSGVDAAPQAPSTAAAYLSYLQIGTYAKQSTADNVNGAAAKAVPSSDAPPYSIEGDAGEQQASRVPAYHTPSPRVFFAQFIRHSAQFIRFLETVALARWGQSIDENEVVVEHRDAPLKPGVLAMMDAPGQDLTKSLRQLGMEPGDDKYEEEESGDQRAIWNTLLELYLASARERSGRDDSGHDGTAVMEGSPDERLDATQRRARSDRALRLLEQHEALPYDITHALVVCTTENFERGLVLLWERLGMYEDVMKLWMDVGSAEAHAAGGTKAEAAKEASHRVMACLRRYGALQPHLYPIVLQYLVSDQSILANHQKDLLQVIAHIEEENIMGPLEVVQALGRTRVATVGLLRDYLSRTVEQERQEIEADQNLITTYRGETSKKLQEVSELTDANHPRVFQMTKCTACGGQLEVPSVHFMCRHSFHHRCLGDGENECPACARAHATVREIRANNEEIGSRHDLFLQQVQNADDGFDAIANMFSKGLFGANRLI